MAIPAVEQFSQQPGGGLVTAMRGVNALTASNLDNQIKDIERQYKPITSQAEAASKLAYANLMGPQFLAKLMGNPDILANLSSEQQKAALAKVYQAGSGQGGSGNALTMPAPQQNQNPLSNLVNHLRGAFGFNAPPSAGATQGASAAPPSQNALNTTPFVQGPNGTSVNDSLRAAGQPTIDNDNGQALPGSFASDQPAPTAAPAADATSANTFPENAGKYAGIKAEGEEAGKIRAKQYEALDQTVLNNENTQTTLDALSKIVASPEFEQIRQTPLAGHHELQYYAKEGTPEQQNMVGQYYTLTGNIITQSARDFAGSFRKGEQELLSGMKPNPSDTVDTARGKLESLSVMNKMLSARARLTSSIMKKEKLSQGDALEQADKKIDGAAIRNQVHDQLNPTVTIVNKKTGERMTVPIGQAREKYGVRPNV
jgi:hypothetical protein